MRTEKQAGNWAELPPSVKTAKMRLEGKTEGQGCSLFEAGAGDCETADESGGATESWARERWSSVALTKS